MATGFKSMTGEQIELNIAKMDPDLRIQMTQGCVPKHCIAVLAEAGFTTSKMFRCFSPSLELFPARAKTMGLARTRTSRRWR